MKQPSNPVLLSWIAMCLTNGAAGYAQARGTSWALMVSWGMSMIVFALFEIAHVIEKEELKQ
jgi:hypothetical protein